VPMLMPVALDQEKLFADVSALVVVAPHPDDDVLGCGGAIAIAAERDLPIHVLYVTDGAASHPGSVAFPPPRLKAVREAEARTALACLAPDASTSFFGWPDGTVPQPGDERAHPLLALLRAAFAAGSLILAPWRRDPHPDHRAVSALVCATVARRDDLHHAEYFVWLDERGAAADARAADEGTLIELDIARHVAAKRNALAEHRSQLGALITDARENFVLPEGLIARSGAPIERYVRW
jgi:LmbE family N-acetylglucosaminyl deacetylase